MKSGDIVRVIKNDMSLAFNAKTRMKDRKFFHKVGIVLDIYHDINLVRYGNRMNIAEVQYNWFDVYFGTAGVYHIREDVLVVECESR